MFSRTFLIALILLLGAAIAGAQVPSPTQQWPVTIQGTVNGPGGQPITGARVAILLPDSNEDDDVFADTVTDVEGKFALFAIPLAPGNYVVHASRAGFASDEKQFVVKAEPVNLSFDLKLKLSAKTRGESTAHTVVRIFYATDREAVTDKESVDYAGIRSAKNLLSFGSCEVSIPGTHTLAEIERPSIWRLEFHADPERHMILRKVAPESKDVFFNQVSAAVATSPSKDAFVFIHGYNMSFERAAIRTAQLTYDLGFKGAPILYSWPSRASLLGYLADEDAVNETTANFKQFLEDVANNTGASVVHVIAHSMGNRAALSALSQLANEPDFPNFAKFSTIVFAAPDVDRDVFIDSIARIRKRQTKITLYVSQHDQALTASRFLFHKGLRAGEGGSDSIVLQGMDTIDVTQISIDALGHSYYGNNSNVVRDLLEFFRGRIAPRPGLSRVPLGALAYWKLTATANAAN
ncbi:MAG TPA: alpha/beta hydrolase [Terracidiphilus sp.]|jgi:esterase/lipase superfamily enzyme